MYVPSSKINRLILLSLLFMASVSHAQNGQTPDPCLSDERCTAFYEIGMRQSKAGMFPAALHSYQDAYERVPAPWLLVNIGRVQQKLGKPEAAITSFQSFLDSPGAQNDPDTTARARKFLQQAQQDLKKPEPKVAYQKDEYQPRPRWRLAVGGVLLGLGALGIVGGIGGLTVHGRCVDLPVAPATQCMQIFDGFSRGIGFLVTGSLLAVSGVVMIALPGPRIEATSMAASVGGVGSGYGLQLAGTF